MSTRPKTFRHVHFDVRRAAACGTVEPGVQIAAASSSVSCPTCYRLALVAEQERLDVAQVLTLCRRIGFGRVMQIAADAWRTQDPLGALTVGPCVGLLDVPPTTGGHPS